MSLPDRPSLTFLRKLAKDRLAELRQTDPRAQLAAAQLLVAREHGFPSWRALKAEIDRRRAPAIEAFFAACEKGEGVRELLAADPSLARERNASDQASGLHVAAAAGQVDAARALLDAGADVHGSGDAHHLDVIGWATCFQSAARADVVALLVERGARHHAFSAVASGDLAALEELPPEAFLRRIEGGKTPLHFAVAPPDGLRGLPVGTPARHAALALLLELGAPVDAEDDRGRTALDVALLVGDAEAARLLREAGAREPTTVRGAAPIAASVKKVVPMLWVPDVAAAAAWYVALGFELVNQAHEFAFLRLGGAELMLSGGGARSADVTLWFYTDRLDDLYATLKARQLAGGDIPFVEDLHETHYGSRELTIRDPNGVKIAFIAA